MTKEKIIEEIYSIIKTFLGSFLGVLVIMLTQDGVLQNIDRVAVFSIIIAASRAGVKAVWPLVAILLKMAYEFIADKFGFKKPEDWTYESTEISK